MNRILIVVLLYAFPCYINAQTYYMQISVQRQIAIDAKYKLKSLAGQVNDKKISIQSYNERYNDARRLMTDLEAEKQNAIKDMKAGYYCSMCWKPKTYFDKRGENFWEHIRSVNGKATPMPNDKMQATERDYDDQIYALKKQSDALFSNINILKQQIANLMDEIDKLPYAWEAAIKEEDRLKVMQWQEDLQAINRIIKQKEEQREPVESLYNDKIRLEQQQEIDKSDWVQKVLAEKEEINESLYLIGISHTYYIYSLSGRPNSSVYYDMNSQPSIYQNNASQLLAPQRPIPSEDRNLKNYLENLGNSK